MFAVISYRFAIFPLYFCSWAHHVSAYQLRVVTSSEPSSHGSGSLAGGAK